jgi:hypothetical protein
VTHPVTLHGPAAIVLPTDYEITKTFAARLLSARLEREWSLRRLAQASGVSHTMVWAAEQCSRHISLVNGFRLATALGKPLSEMLEPIPCNVCLGRPARGMTCDTCRRSTPLRPSAAAASPG